MRKLVKLHEYFNGELLTGNISTKKPTFFMYIVPARVSDFVNASQARLCRLSSARNNKC